MKGRNGGPVASTSGPSAVQLSLELPAGTYWWKESGANASFILHVTHMQ